VKLFIAVPAYDRKLTCETARALLNEQGAAQLAGVGFQVSFIPGSSLITVARDQAVREFMNSDADRLIFIDSDVCWDAGQILALARHDKDFVGGAYRYKDATEGYPVQWLDRDELWADPETGLLEVAALPGGFLSLSRKVFDTLAAKYPERAYFFHGEAFQAYFHCPPGGGEDGAFCADWCATGGQIWLDPSLTLTHVEGPTRYTGNIGNWLKSRA